ETPMTDIASGVPAFSFGRSCDISSADLPEGATMEDSMRPSGRAADAMRLVTLDPGAAKYAEGSCLAKFGDTPVLGTASVEERVLPFLRNAGWGWVTAEYG